MLTVYTAPSCTSCKKAKTWLADHHIPYDERNLISDPLTVSEITHILEKCDDGIESLVSTRNRYIKDLAVDFNEMTFGQAVKVISENPQILRRPIIMDDKRLHIGYNEEEIRTFLPRTVREIENLEARLQGAV